MAVAAPPVRRAWTYLQERFPLFAHGPLVLAFAGGVACASAALRGAEGPGWAVVAVAFIVALGAFFQLRVADEWKDADEDRRFRPERPVPRGLVTLRQLAMAGLGVAVVQVGVCIWLDARLLIPLAMIWGFGALMTVEFGVRDWLHERPAATLLSHAPIVPVIDFFSVSCDVLGNGADYPDGTVWLVAVSLVGGMVVEVGRKVWASADEREGVYTYSAVWGQRRALGVWAAVILLSAIFGATMLGYIPDTRVLQLALIVGGIATLALGFLALRGDRPGAGSRLETLSGVWTLGLYATLGPIALLLT
ncbi:MAG: UbiA family prenyltransferase [Bacteroidota bacterium]